MLPQSSPMNFWMLGGVLAAGLLVFAAAIVLHVLAAGPGRRPSWGETFAWARGLMWTLPVLAVTALVVGRAAPLFQDPAAAETEAVETLQIELNDPEEGTIELDRESAPPAETAEAPEPQPDKLEKGKAEKIVRAVKEKVERILGEPEPAPVTDDPPEIRSTARSPEWISKPVTQDGDATLIVLSSKEHPTLADAEKEVLARAAAKVRSDFEQSRPTNVDWTVPADAIRFRLSHEEKIPRKAGNVSFTMFKAHRQLEISKETREAAFQAFRGEVVRQRLWGLGSVLGMATLIVAGSAFYLRLDARTHGHYRTRLKAATVAAMTAGGLLLTATL